jgi:phospholipid/cholesterol/gamma-HCH transport system substrate-binding protein
MTSYARGFQVLRVGCITLIAAVTFAALFLYTTNRTLTRGHSTLFLSFTSAEGLKKGDAVLHHGVQVGEVKSLEFGGAGVLVRARITQPVELRNGASAALVAADIFGRQSVVLRPGTGSAVIMDGDTLYGTPPASLTAKLDQLGARAGRLIGDTTVAMLHAALGGVGGATRDIATLAATAEVVLAEQHRAVAAVTTELAGMAANLSAVTDSVATVRIRDHLETSAAQLARTTARIDSAALTLNHILATIESGNGSAARLLNDPQLYDRTAGALASLEALLTDLRQNPKRYINISVF